MNRSEGDQRLSRTRRLLAVQTAVGVVLGVLVAGVVTLVVVLGRLDADLQSRLQTAAAAADTQSPPEGLWVATVDGRGQRTASPTAPRGLPTSEQLTEARAGSVVVEEVHTDGGEYLTHTELHGAMVVQTGVDFGPRDAEGNRLLLGLAVAGSLATVAAVLIGRWLSGRAIAPLEVALARQRRFVADASHELRTPLARLTLRAQILQRTACTNSPRDLDEDAALLVAEAQDMAAIVEDLLLSAQMEQSPIHGELVDLEQVATRVVAAERPRAAQRRVGLDLTTREVAPVRGVAIALTRAVNALVDNALSHATEDGHVHIDLRTDSQDVVLSVGDDGPGIAAVDRERLFERFARGHTDRGRFGLGLALVREVVESHGGTVRLDPDHAPGARFVVRLPAAAATADQDSPAR